MATFERARLEAYAPGATVEESVANFAAADGCWRIYRYRHAECDASEYTHYAVLGTSAEEAAMLKSGYVLDPELVWEREGEGDGRHYPSLFDEPWS
jgi:hypothetical protein